MRKIIPILFALLGAALLAGCGSSSKKEAPSPLAGKLAGEWHLTSWNGDTPEKFDIYVSFDAGNFTVYQRFESVEYLKYTGSYLLKNDELTGQYSDNNPWGGSYTAQIDESGDTLTLTSATGVTEVSVYTRTPIPSAIKNGAAVMKAARGAAFRLF